MHFQQKKIFEFILQLKIFQNRTYHCAFESFFIVQILIHKSRVSNTKFPDDKSITRQDDLNKSDAVTDESAAEDAITESG